MTKVATLIFILLISTAYCKKFFLKLEDTQIDITSLNKCDAKQDYQISVQNISVKSQEARYLISGTLFTKIDILSPLKAVLKVERDELGIWITVPCIDEVGSCTYSDLCIHGVPKNTSCPPDYIKNGVPCRCPIPKGNYTLDETGVNISNVGNIVSGKYYAKVTLEYENKELTCYEVYFRLSENMNKNNVMPSVKIV